MMYTYCLFIKSSCYVCGVGRSVFDVQMNVFLVRAMQWGQDRALQRVQDKTMQRGKDRAMQRGQDSHAKTKLKHVFLQLFWTKKNCNCRLILKHYFIWRWAQGTSLFMSIALYQRGLSIDVERRCKSSFLIDWREEEESNTWSHHYVISLSNLLPEISLLLHHLNIAHFSHALTSSPDPVSSGVDLS